MVDLEELRAFLNVVDAGSFLAAADSLGVSRTTLRRRIEGLEARAGVQLIKNTPRGIIVTDAGQVLAKRGRVMVQDVGVLVSSLRKIGGQPEGVLNVVMPVGLPPHLLTPLFAALRAAYPALRVSCRISDDPLQEPLEDVDIAVHFGDEEPPSPWLSYVIMRVRRWLVASTEYLARRGTPKDIEQLRMHELLAWRAPRTDGSIWPLVSGSTFRVEPA
ncbi:MAG: LysR family transcriptional regulator, partial [Polyangiaceae bacterium]|nr:LysR family transcriptional regulator [Polyangiaceae bacterium]